MIIEKTQKGHLLITAEAADQYDLAQIKERVGGNDHQALTEILDVFGFLGNGYINISGAVQLTDAPLIATEATQDESGTWKVQGEVWWYPGYESTNFLDLLIEKGSIIFQVAQK